VIDTSGTHPAVAACTQAITDARTASAVLAALPPTRQLGNIQVKLDGYYHIDAAPNEVIQIDRLDVQGAHLPRVYGGGAAKYCDNVERVADLDIGGGPAVINIGQLSIGNCAYLNMSGSFLFNVPGKGKAINIGVEATSPDILAPDRTVNMNGSSDDGGSYPGRIWAGTVVSQGYLVAGYTTSVDCWEEEAY
jgi:hypothetical protein